MRINKQVIDDLRNYIADKTAFEQLAEAAFKKQSGRLFGKLANNFANILIESMLIENAYKSRLIRIATGYGKMSYDVKKNKNVSEISENKKFLNENEETFARGFNRFINTFDFNDRLLKHQLRVFFKNYRFRTPNIINDYSILYFTFKIYDKLCDNSEIDRKACAIECAKSAFERLHNPRKKKSVTVTFDSLISYVRKFEFLDWQLEFISIFLDFIEDIYYADEIDEITQFSFFDRFSKQLLLINIWLNAILKDKPLIPTADEKIILKKSSNRIQYSVAKNAIPHDELRQIKELQHIFSLLGNHIDKLLKPSKKYIDICNRIYELADTLSKSKNDETIGLFYKVMNDFSELCYISGDMYTVAFDAIYYDKTKPVLKEFQKLITKYHTDNVYLLLTLSMSENAKTIKELYQEVIFDVEKYINNLHLDGDVSNETTLLNLLSQVDLNKFNVPIIDTINVCAKNKNYLAVLKQYLF